LVTLASSRSAFVWREERVVLMALATVAATSSASSVVPVPAISMVCTRPRVPSLFTEQVVRAALMYTLLAMASSCSCCCISAVNAAVLTSAQLVSDEGKVKPCCTT
jgi:hypothetical protein